MKVHQNIDEFRPEKDVVLTCGTFDGVHKGHLKLLERISALATASDGESVLLTFWPHPRIVLDPEYHLQLLSSFEEKVALVAKAGIDHLISIPFSREFSNLGADDYVRQVIVEKLKTKTIVIGYDHRFGKNRSGGLEDLQRLSKPLGFTVEEITRQEIDDIVVSSTMIRQHLHEGNIPVATEYLGRPYSLSGIVIRGDQLGRKIGFPTANIQVSSEHKLIPGDGSYAVRIRLNGSTKYGMMNIGFRPTIDGKKRTIETHIFDFDRDIYGNNVVVEFIDMIRKEIKFNSLEELQSQLKKDKISAKQIIANEKI